MSIPTFRFEEAADSVERMDELERFLEYWFGRQRPEHGEPESSLDRLPLPYPLRRFHQFAGRRPSADPDSLERFYTGSGGHHLRDVDSMEAIPDGRLDFFMEYQGDWFGLTTPDADDPPVWLNGFFEEGDEEERTIQVCGSLSKFLITHCLMTILYESENAPCSITAREGPLVDRFHHQFGKAVRIWSADDLNWPPSCLVYRGDFHLIPFSGGILVHRDGADYRFGALRASAVSVMVGDLLRGPHR